MCFGPSKAERQLSASQREEALMARQQEIMKRAEQKREDISAALEGRIVREWMRGGAGPRSLFTSAFGSSGYASRFR